MNAQGGFTLVEALAAGIISTVVAGAILSVLYMTNDQIKSGTAINRLADLQVVTFEQIHRSARFADGAMYGAETAATIALEEGPPFNVAAQTLPISEIRFYGQNYWLISGYRIGRDYLEEGVPNPPFFTDLTWKPFRVGNDIVFLDSAKSHFRILQGRQGIYFSLRHASQFDTLPQDSGNALCRN